MKKILSLIICTSLLVSCGNRSEEKENKKEENTNSTTILIKGSDTVLPLAQKLAEEYMKKHADINVTIVGGGSGVGIAALLDATTDIAMSSRPLKQDEKLKLNEKKVTAQEFIVANDALSLIVNKDNPVNELTREQIEDIYTGKIKNWKEVGGKDNKTIYYSRETSSGTYEFFREHVLNKKNFGNEALLMSAIGAIVQSVSQTNGAIGYVGLAYETPEVKSLKISYDQGKTFVAPSVEAAQDKTYPVARPLFFYHDQKMGDNVKAFLDFVLSAEGQVIVKEVGYVPLVK